MVTNKQNKDIETIKFFIPSWCKFDEPSNSDIRKFLEYSERGFHKELVDCRNFNGFNALIQGKRWRGIHIHEMWVVGVQEGSVPYVILFEDIPNSVIEYAAKEMFKGNDTEMINQLYIN